MTQGWCKRYNFTLENKDNAGAGSCQWTAWVWSVGTADQTGVCNSAAFWCLDGRMLVQPQWYIEPRRELRLWISSSSLWRTWTCYYEMTWRRHKSSIVKHTETHELPQLEASTSSYEPVPSSGLVHSLSSLCGSMALVSCSHYLYIKLLSIHGCLQGFLQSISGELGVTCSNTLSGVMATHYRGLGKTCDKMMTCV